MATKVAVVPGSTTAKIVTMGSAFVTGLAMSQIVKAKPTWGMPMTLVLGATGVVGAMYLEGAWAEVAQGIAAASMATLGASLPTLIGAGGGTASRVGMPAAARTGVPVSYDWRDTQPVAPKV